VPERLYTLKKAWLLLGLHPKTIQKWDKQGKIRIVRTPGGGRGIPKLEIRRLQQKEVVERAKNLFTQT
jgi:putative resolvase